MARTALRPGFRLFAPALAFVDIETTGMGPATEAITEIAIVRVTADADDPESLTVDEWSTLVNPGRPIPSAIQALTGIRDDMVQDAPPFAAVADDVAARIGDALFVAHNARFDYGFLKHAYARLGRDFSARVLCTVRLSRRLFPDAAGHGLDAVVDRHGLECADRHRALGDARLLWRFVQALYASLPGNAIAEATKRVLRTPSLPPHLPREALDALPEAPGVYRFYGQNAHPLYIGKSLNLRERVAAHFSADYRSATDTRLSAEIHRIEFERTAGEIGALLRESALVKALMPAHNHALRRKAEAVLIALPTEPGPPRYLPAASLAPADLPGLYGPFTSRRTARESLRQLANKAALCWKLLGLEQRVGPCFARQVRRCAGACVGAEPEIAHHRRLAAALAPMRIPDWPYDGPVGLREHDPLTGQTDIHVIRDWCWLGTARDDAELGELVAMPPRPAFDPDITRLLIRTLKRGRPELIHLVRHTS